MEANELRIGNWVDTIKGPKQIIEVRRSENYPKEVGTEVTDDVRVSGLFLGPIGGVFQIPLTEEWLIKLGFEEGEYIFTLGINPLNHDHLIVIKKSILQSDGDYFYYQNGTFKIQYVHQLQNLYFALTGEELTIKE